MNLIKLFGYSYEEEQLGDINSYISDTQHKTCDYQNRVGLISEIKFINLLIYLSI